MERIVVRHKNPLGEFIRSVRTATLAYQVALIVGVVNHWITILAL